MATYKVPQDVEADDKLLGPFSFRQFIYLMIILGMVVLAYGLFQLFPLLALIPVPFIIFFGILALPVKKEQPMETYLSALISFYTKPNKRYWVPGQSESTILITAPKQVEDVRTRELAPDDASHRLSFLAELVDSEGHAIKNASTTMKDEFYAEAYNTTDMFEQKNNYGLGNMMTTPTNERHDVMVDQMRDAIANSDYNYESRIAKAGTIQLPGQRVIQPREGFTGTFNDYLPSGAPGTISGFESPNVVQPIFTPATPVDPASQPGDFYNDPSQLYAMPGSVELRSPTRPQPENIQQQADRIRQENESEVFVSLH